jgi:hypothetical protein
MLGLHPHLEWRPMGCCGSAVACGHCADSASRSQSRALERVVGRKVGEFCTIMAGWMIAHSLLGIQLQQRTEHVIICI